MRHAITVAALIWYSAAPLFAQAAPYTPKEPQHVLERLPGRIDATQRELQKLRERLAKSPEDLALATEMARRYIETGRREGDPRYFGYAQAALRPWWNAEKMPPEARLLRATLLQSQHQFTPALADLEVVLKTDRTDAQALLTRATILQVQGRHAEAKASCAKLYARVPQLVTISCISNVASLTGQADKSYALLMTSLQREPDADAGLRRWVMTLLAEMAERRGDFLASEKHYLAALALGSDSYLLGAYADFLLARHRPADAARLVKKQVRVDALLLRYAEALQQSHDSAVSLHIATLRERFAAARMRGDTIHQREQARFELRLLHDPKGALRTAQQNWAIQKEPADARLLLEAAFAAGDRSTIEAMASWLRSTGLQDQSLLTLMSRAKKPA